jgi:cell wall-associated NlpC family hydrolase
MEDTLLLGIFEKINSIMTHFGICNSTLIPVRKEPSECAEMVSQVLFGETFQVLEIQNNWSYIKIDFDSYLGWVDTKMYKLLTEEEYRDACSKKKTIVTELFVAANSGSIQGNINITAGADLYNYSNNEFELHTDKYKLLSNIQLPVYANTREAVVANAIKFLNIPYLWGGRSVFGIDCSGLVQTAFKMSQIKLPRDSSQQVNLGKEIAFIEKAQPGDIAFFDNADGKIVHTGIVLADKQIIHASGKVRIDTIDHQGIFNQHTNKYSHKLRIIKSIL